MGTWNTKQLAYLQENYSCTKNSILASNLGKTKCAISEKARRMGLEKTPSFLHDINIGHVAHNRVPVMSERLSIDGYRLIKVSEPNEWKPKHRVIWEKNNGKIPHGARIRFKDGNRTNICLENLYLAYIKTNAPHSNTPRNRKAMTSIPTSPKPITREIIKVIPTSPKPINREIIKVVPAPPKTIVRFRKSEFSDDAWEGTHEIIEKKPYTLKEMRTTLDTLRNMERIQAESGDVEGFIDTRRKADMLYYKIESLSRKKFYDSEFSAGSIHFNSASDE